MKRNNLVLSPGFSQPGDGQPLAQCASAQAAITAPGVTNSFSQLQIVPIMEQRRIVFCFVAWRGLNGTEGASMSNESALPTRSNASDKSLTDWVGAGEKRSQMRPPELPSRGTYIYALIFTLVCYFAADHVLHAMNYYCSLGPFWAEFVGSAVICGMFFTGGACATVIVVALTFWWGAYWGIYKRGIYKWAVHEYGIYKWRLDKWQVDQIDQLD